MQQHKQMNVNTYSRRQSSRLLQKRVRFYTGLPGFDVLNTTFCFSPIVSQKSKTLILFQEFVVVLVKLRPNVPLQDLAFRFGTSLSTLSRTFTAWFTVMGEFFH